MPLIVVNVLEIFCKINKSVTTLVFDNSQNYNEY